jgi:epoxyqueuosine reductase
MNLNNRISILAQSLGADYCGVAELPAARAFIEWQGGERVAGYPQAVVMGIRLLDEYVDLLAEREDPAAAGLYRHYTYDVVN